MIDAEKTVDAEVSPMEAQNEGPAHSGPAKEPLPDTEGKPEDTAPPSPIRQGGEGESRDDL
ncbi:hypothetical protein [Aureimonas glaciei]|jgi:hypothetical protein|uniref:Uncharacterized protein n=1 Tax=Aureimonas glaciei TaxID=1776957 RepID=A0A916V204_9HYPH|nr:hypothetical protein [Aureimonas glaciei]GGD02112.1 hypothetical protein GCM10011335_00900 [Aureimonas glaciei]